MVSRLPRRATGFTLVELLTVITIVGVLAAVAAPSMSKLMESQRARGSTGELFASIQLARSEAIKRNVNVTLRPISSGAWENGWTISNPNNGAAYLEQHGPVLKTTITGPTSLVFQGNGRLQNTTKPQFNISTKSGAAQRCIEVDLGGRPLQKSNAC